MLYINTGYLHLREYTILGFQLQSYELADYHLSNSELKHAWSVQLVGSILAMITDCVLSGLWPLRERFHGKAPAATRFDD